jgi:hypothetical protein
MEGFLAIQESDEVSAGKFLATILTWGIFLRCGIEAAHLACLISEVLALKKDKFKRKRTS